MPPGFHHDKRPKAVGVVTDIVRGPPSSSSLSHLINQLQGDGTPDQYELPAPSKGGALPPSPTAASSPAQANGHLHQDDRTRYEDRVGWAPRFGQGSSTEAETDESPLDHQTWVESKLDDKFFGGKVYVLDTSNGTDRQNGITTPQSSSSRACPHGSSPYWEVVLPGFS